MLKPRALVNIFINAMAAFGAATAVYIGSSHAFPDIKEYLRSKGYDPALADRLSDNTHIHVRNGDSVSGYLHSSFDWMTNYIGSPYNTDSRFMYMQRGDIFRYLGKPDIINIPESVGKTLKSKVIYFLGVSPELIERDPLPEDQAFFIDLAHEIHHGDSKNKSLPTIEDMEIGADNAAVTVSSDIYANPEIKPARLHYRGLNLYNDHDIVLALRAHFDGGTPPAVNEIIKTRAEITNAIRTRIIENKIIPETRPWRTGRETEIDMAVGVHIEMLHHLLAGGTLSPLARDRAQMFMDASDYFMPTFTRRVRNSAEQSRPAPVLTQ